MMMMMIQLTMIRRARISDTVPFHHNITHPTIKTKAPEPDWLKNFHIDEGKSVQARKEHDEQKDNIDKHSDSRSDVIEPRRKGYNKNTSRVIYSYG